MDSPNFSTVAICRLHFLALFYSHIVNGYRRAIAAPNQPVGVRVIASPLVCPWQAADDWRIAACAARKSPRRMSLPITDQFSAITGNQGLGAGVGRPLGEGATLGPVNSIVRIGGLALSRVSNRFAVAMAVSSPNTSQPKLLAGLSSQDCTSATICAELHV